MKFFVVLLILVSSQFASANCSDISGEPLGEKIWQELSRVTQVRKAIKNNCDLTQTAKCEFLPKPTTALKCAAFGGYPQAVNELLNTYKNTRERAQKAKEAMAYAIINHRSEVIDRLLKEEIDYSRVIDALVVKDGIIDPQYYDVAVGIHKTANNFDKSSCGYSYESISGMYFIARKMLTTDDELLGKLKHLSRKSNYDERQKGCMHASTGGSQAPTGGSR